jgi:hypothetical protein
MMAAEGRRDDEEYDVEIDEIYVEERETASLRPRDEFEEDGYEYPIGEDGFHDDHDANTDEGYHDDDNDAIDEEADHDDEEDGVFRDDPGDENASYHSNSQLVLWNSVDKARDID